MEALLHNLIKATGWSIIHSLWQGAFIYGLLMLSQMNMFRLKSKIRYNIAYGASCLLFCCFVVTFISTFQWPAEGTTTLINVTDAYAANINAQPHGLTQYAEMLFPYLVCCYGIGLAIQSALVYQGYKKINHLKKSAHELVPEAWATIFNGLLQKLQIKKEVTFWLSARIQVPMIIGFAKPVVLFPFALAAQMDIHQVEAILIHELSHIRRNDYLFNLIRTVIDTILFFNPFIWLNGKFIDIEREHACDDLVVALTHTPMTYAHALLQLELLTNSHEQTLALAATGKKQYLYQRIKRITDMKTNYMNSKQKLFAVTLTLATVISLAWINPGQVHNLNNKKTPKTTLGTKQAVVTESLMHTDHVQADLQDTTKKKLKKRVIIKCLSDSAFVYTGVSDTDTVTNKLIDDAMHRLKTTRIKIDSVSGSIYGFGKNGLTFTDIDAFNGKTMVIKSMGGQGYSYNTEKSQSPLSGDEQKKLKDLSRQMANLTRKMQRQLNSGRIDQSKKSLKELKEQGYTAKERAEMKKIQAEMQTTSLKIQDIVGTEDFLNKTMTLAINSSKKAVTELNALSKINGRAFDINFSPELSVRISDLRDRMNTAGLSYSETKELKNSEEYIALKKKFDEDVKAIADKKLKKEKE